MPLEVRPADRYCAAMNLEDQIGDIICKARLMTKISSPNAAQAAGLSEIEFALLESASHIPPQTHFAALARVLGLDPQKFEGIARGWTPVPADLSLWREIRVFTTAAEGITVNNYLIWDEVNKEAALFDTGLEAREALACIAENELQLRHIFITHSHFDHVQALPEIRAAWPKARVHSGSHAAPVDQRNKPSEIIHLGGLRVTHRDTPGHAADGVTYIVGNWQEDAPHIAIVGDAIFAGSMGRGNDSWEVARQKVREQILSLPADTLICPGHGPLTTVAQEKAHNPFF
jgi:glyoxylase-like metal-dependent hydrolase (beta-lactamase superfamily II)